MQEEKKTKSRIRRRAVKETNTEKSKERVVSKISAKPTLKVIPLGGLCEIGKNMTAIEYQDDIIIIDCGMTFPEDEMLGIDYVIPDITYLVKNKEKLRALIITHGHEDHIGAVPYFLRDLPEVPVYSATLTLALIENKLNEHGIRGTHMQTVKPGEKVKIGCFEVTFMRVCHSIADAMALAIKTPVGMVVHTGDFKIDHTPLDGQVMDLGAFAKLGDQGVLLLMSDSTNAERPGYTMSEQRVKRSIQDLMGQATGRILLATFSSNINRIQQVINIAESYGRKVFFAGRSLERTSKLAMEIGYLQMKKGTLVDEKRLDYLEPHEVVIITTGSQGEPMSGLVRMASDEHRQVHVQSGDMVIISASPIPGNEKNVSNVIDKLFKKGANVIYEGIREVHVSGHACQEEQKLMLALTRPKYFMPVHGEYRHLIAHATTALGQGIPEENIIKAENGDVVEFTKKSAKITGKVPFGAVLVDGSGIGDVGNVVIRDRKLLSEEGLMVVVVTLDMATGKMLASPEILSRGFVYVRENEELITNVREKISKIVSEYENNYTVGDWGNLKNVIRNAIRTYLYTQTKRNPMILPIIIEVDREV